MNKDKDIDIESFLRENKPQVKDNPVFLLEVQRKMRTVDGIKAEVDRQRNYRRISLAVALILGLTLGSLAMMLAYLYPIDTEAVSSGIISTIRAFIEEWKHFLMILIAGCSIALGIIPVVKRQKSMNM